MTKAGATRKQAEADLDRAHKKLSRLSAMTDKAGREWAAAYDRYNLIAQGFPDPWAKRERKKL